MTIIDDGKLTSFQDLPGCWLQYYLPTLISFARFSPLIKCFHLKSAMLNSELEALHDICCLLDALASLEPTPVSSKIRSKNCNKKNLNGPNYRVFYGPIQGVFCQSVFLWSVPSYCIWMSGFCNFHEMSSYCQLGYVISMHVKKYLQNLQNILQRS